MSLLDIDDSAFHNSLLVTDENTASDKDSINSLIESFVNKEHEVPTKLVTPIPGMCVKTFTKDGEKVFVNICHTEEVPYPKGSTIPMSIGYQKEITDAHGNPSIAFDVAVNSSLFHKNQSEIIILTIIEGVANKHGLSLSDRGFHILKNVKCKGKIQPMNIEQRAPKADPPKKPLISEIDSENVSVSETKSEKSDFVVPDFNLLKINGPEAYYASEIDLKNVFSKEEINLQVGEDRVFLSTNGKFKYQLDYHLPENVNSDSCNAEFDSDLQILTLTAPVRKLTRTF